MNTVLFVTDLFSKEQQGSVFRTLPSLFSSL